MNLPGQPKAIKETLEGVKDEQGKVLVKGILVQCLIASQLIDGIYIDTKPEVIASFRPKAARHCKFGEIK